MEENNNEINENQEIPKAMQKDENSEVPKALQNNENNEKTENTDNQNKTITNETEVKDNKTEKNTNNKKFKKYYIIYVIILLIITIVAIYFTIRYIDSSKIENNEVKEEIIEEETKEITKKKAEDEKYALTKYSETYNENDLIFNEDSGVLQIDGLKDKQVQNIVNNKIKEKVNSLDKNKRVNTQVTANFSNVLGVSIYNLDESGSVEKEIYLNIDLSTGDEIPFEEIFVSSAPINSILSEGLYKTLAWNVKSKNTNEENWEEDFDMSKVDTSDFEDKSLLLSKKYEKEKGKIKYSLYFDKIIVYGLLDGITDKNDKTITIKFVDHLENIAIFKRFETKESIYESSDIGLKNIIVCEYPTVFGIKDVVRDITLNLGFVSKNTYMEDFFEYYVQDMDESAIKNIEKYIQNISNDTKNDLINNSNNGLIFQRVMYLHQDRNKTYYYVELIEAKSTCDIEYFNNLAFKDYIKLKTQPKADASIDMFNDDEYSQEKYPNLKITRLKEEKKLYFSLNGEYIGDNEEEAIRKTTSNNETNTNPEHNNASNTHIENSITTNTTNRINESTDVNTNTIDNSSNQNSTPGTNNTSNSTNTNNNNNTSNDNSINNTNNTN